MPALFIGHGSPMNALEQNRYTEAWQRIGAALPKPSAILVISAHWQTRGTAVTAMPSPRTIHDFGGFPQALFDFQYPAPGEPALAQRVGDVLAPMAVQQDQTWGLDHGAWSVLAHLFPRADIPVVQLSMDATQPNAFHYHVGKKLAALREAGVLIIGSGNVVHNLRVINFATDTPPFEWATRFEQSVKNHLQQNNHAPLIDYVNLGADAQWSIPTPEHFLPLLYIMGMQRDGEAVTFPVEGIDLGSISMLSVQLG